MTFETAPDSQKSRSIAVDLHLWPHIINFCSLLYFFQIVDILSFPMMCNITILMPFEKWLKWVSKYSHFNYLCVFCHICVITLMNIHLHVYLEPGSNGVDFGWFVENTHLVGFDQCTIIKLVNEMKYEVYNLYMWDIYGFRRAGRVKSWCIQEAKSLQNLMMDEWIYICLNMWTIWHYVFIISDMN